MDRLACSNARVFAASMLLFFRGVIPCVMRRRSRRTVSPIHGNRTSVTGFREARNLTVAFVVLPARRLSFPRALTQRLPPSAGTVGAGSKTDDAVPDEPPPPGTPRERPPLPPSALVRREAALVHRVMALLGEVDAASPALLSLLAEAEDDGVDVPRWLGLGRSSNGGRTPLMEAARQGQTACVAALADAACAGGRGLNARNERGRYSALHYACYHGAVGEFSCGVLGGPGSRSMEVPAH